MNVLPGSPHPLGAVWDGSGVNFALYSEHATAVELCLFDEDGAETRLAVAQRTAFVWHGYVPDVGARAALRLPRPRPVRAGARAALQSRARAARSVRQAPSTASSAGTRAASRTSSASPTRTCARRRGPRSGRRAASSIDPDVRLGRRRAAAHAAAPVGDLRGARARARRCATRRCPRSCAAPTPASRTRRSSPPAASSASPRSSCCRCTPSSTTSTLLDRGLRNYWGYNTIGFFAPDVRYRSGGRARQRGARVQDDGEASCTARASR